MRDGTKILRYIFAVLMLVLPLCMKAQQDTILLNRDTTITTCNMMLYDSGGKYGNYSNNENYILKVCGTGTVGMGRMAVDIISLNTESNFDYICIYEGDSAASNYLVARMDGNNIADSIFYLQSNCVTILFHSDGSVNRAGFEINIYCRNDCQEYSQNILDDGLYEGCHLLCNSSSIVSNPIFYNNNVEYEQTIENTFFRWSIFNENRSVSGLGRNTLDSLSNGLYFIELTIIDQAHCVTTSGLMTFMVMGNPEVTLSEIPENASVYDTLLISGDVSMDGNFYYNLLDYGSAYGCIENEGEAIFNDIVHRFPDDAVISSPNDIESICMEMEHSYLGDLEMWITCPSGNRMDIINGYRNSYCNNQFLGEPNDYDEMCMSGEPYQYCWTHDASLTMEAQASNSPSHSYVDNAGHAYSNHPYIPEGNYLTTGDWSSLVGCPMNGVWSLHIYDHMGADDGYVFSFSIQFDSEIPIDSTNWMPVFEEDDFAWNGQGIISGQNGSSTIAVSGSEPGLQSYTLSVTNNYGCTYDTTFSILFCEPHLEETFITECDSVEYNGVVYHESGDYLVSAVCGSEEMLHLTLGHTTDTVITVRNCGEYSWNDEIFAESGTYTRQYQGFAGCDSVVTLNLIVGEPEIVETTVIACGYNYEMNGYTYTEEGNYIQVLRTINGCDSIVLLSLRFAEPIETEVYEDIHACRYIWNGQEYTSSGDYVQHLTSGTYCDSVVTLHLVLYSPQVPQVYATENMEPCNQGAILLYAGGYESYLWSNGETSQMTMVVTPGYYYVEVTDEYDCHYFSEPILVGESDNIDEIPSVSYMTVTPENRVKISWNEINSRHLDSYNIYRENDDGIFEFMANIGARQSRIWVDENSNPSYDARAYCVSAVDDCGAETRRSDPHRNIFAEIDADGNLRWNEYEGVIFDYYKIYESPDVDNMVCVDTVPYGTNRYDLDPSMYQEMFPSYTWPFNVFYAVEGITIDGSVSSMSNRASTAFVTHTVTVMASQGGSVTGSGEYPERMVVTLQAFPDEGYKFMSWDDGNTDNPRTVCVTGDMYFIAYFANDDRYCVSVVASDSAGGFVFGSGMYESGSIATVGALPNENYTFMGWEDGSNENPRRFVVNEDVELVAVFEHGNTVLEYSVNGITVYPNPTDGWVSISAESVISDLEIVSLTGQVLHKQAVDAENIILNVGNLPSGVYFARVWISGESLPINLKFVKQ